MPETENTVVEIEVVPKEITSNTNPYLLLLFSGVLSTIGSACSKLTTTDMKSMTQFFSDNLHILFSADSYILYVLKCLCFAMSLTLGGISMTIYVNAMTILGSLPATVISSGFNFVFSGVFGWLLFHEVITLKWLLGGFCVMLGLLFIVYDNK